MKSNLIKLFLFGCLLMPWGAKAAGAVKYFCIELRNGTKTEFALSDTPKITFANGSMSASTAKESITVALSDIVHYNFSENSQTLGISTPLQHRVGKPQADYTEGHIRLRGLLAGAPVSVVTIGGRLVYKAKASSDGLLELNLSSYPAGVYVVCTPSGNLKIAVTK